MRRALLPLAAAMACSLGSACDGDGPPTPTATPTITPTATVTPTETPIPTPTVPPRDRYQSAPCAFEVPAGETADCGYLTVAEHRQRPHEGEIRLHVAVFRSHSSAPAPDPVVYLEGGPGGSSLELVPFVFEDWYEPFLEERDLVLFDQRGVGYSEPALDCPEVRDALERAIREDLRAAQSADLGVSAHRACRDRLAGEGVALDAYNSKESAADLEELRQALGYEKWNVFGISYGTKLALTYMRDFPQGVRSVVLDSTYPLQVDGSAEFVPNVRRAFEKLFAGCAAHPDCGPRYPNLERALFEAARRLNATPASVAVIDVETGEPLFEASVTGDELLVTVFQALYSEDLIRDLPLGIALAEEGNYNFVGYMLGIALFNEQFFSPGMHVSVQCNEEVSFSSRATVEASARPYPALKDFVEGDPTFGICGAWGAGKAAPEENRAVTSTVPTLIFAGEYDPITPPAWGRLVNDDLESSFFFEFPGVGHGAMNAGDCPSSIAFAFLRRPAVQPDASCIAGMGPPNFAVN